MKQLLQNLRNGAITLQDVPAPVPAAGQVVIRTQASLISAGSERALLGFGRSNWLQRARAHPEKVSQVLDKVRADGVMAALDGVSARLDEPLPLGYCNAGIVLQVGEGVRGVAAGDRVVSNGPHAEIVRVPETLCARIPSGLGDEEAAFAVLGAVALQGMRLLRPTLGECVCVYGLGLVGLLSVQLLRAHGCRVLGLDPHPSRCELARALGAEASHDPGDARLQEWTREFSRGRGMDGVLITASSREDDIVHQSATMTRKRGRIILVGVVDLQLRRSEFYEKELMFQVSCSYGPGRYDTDYEAGRDYPHAFVRWTAQRNFEAVLDSMVSGRIDVRPLITRRLPLEEADQAYDLLTRGDNVLGIVLTYATTQTSPTRVIRRVQTRGAPVNAPIVVGVIGAGAFANMVLLPALRATGARLKTIVARSGVGAAQAARRFGFEVCASHVGEVLEDPGINTVFILTRHDSHARLVAEALRGGKHVFVEKPLALNAEEVRGVARAYEDSGRHLLVGFNRRFAPLTRVMRELLGSRVAPLSAIVTVNAGDLPSDHWALDPRMGGGRIIGEAVHWIDLLVNLIGHPVIQVTTVAIPDESTSGRSHGTVSITMSFSDGSVGTIHYLTAGHRKYPKERLECFVENQVLQLDNFRRLHIYGSPSRRGTRLWRQDKGHRAEVSLFVDRIIHGGEPLISFDELRHVTLVSFAADHSRRTGSPIRMEEFIGDPPSMSMPPLTPSSAKTRGE
jgi:predicted dehydrogenase/threonine dehydrogenase-like Zn-dependent dehydrogenase